MSVAPPRVAPANAVAGRFLNDRHRGNHGRTSRR